MENNTADQRDYVMLDPVQKNIGKKERPPVELKKPKLMVVAKSLLFTMGFMMYVIVVRIAIFLYALMTDQTSSAVRALDGMAPAYLVIGCTASLLGLAAIILATVAGIKNE